MSSKCLHCRVNLGNYLYADVCPHCGEELKHNTRVLTLPVKQTLHRSWLARRFLALRDLVER